MDKGIPIVVLPGRTTVGILGSMWIRIFLLWSYLEEPQFYVCDMTDRLFTVLFTSNQVTNAGEKRTE